MGTRFLTVLGAALLAGCATSNEIRPGGPSEDTRPTIVAEPDLTAHLAIGGVT